jgi:phospholipid/cholesterol/gamma-HCH transport system permease protein
MEESAATNNPLAKMGNKGIDWIHEMGRLGVFFFYSFIHMFSYPWRIRKIIQQIYFIGTRSILVILLTGATTGMVLGLQGYYALVKFGSEGVLGAVVALTLIREMGPVLAAIMITARAGSAIAAEIGVMRISEQIDALVTMDINPIRFLVSPKLAASIVSFPLLTAIFDTIGIIGSYLTAVVLLGINSGVYVHHMESKVVMDDVLEGFIKSFVFAAIVATICCFQGYYTHLRADGFGARGVSNATTSAVVMSCVLILVFDYVITSFLV